MADLRKWTEIRRALNDPLKLSNEELNDLIVEFMQRTNTFFDIETLKRHLTPEQYKTLMKNLGNQEIGPEVQLRVEKDDYDRYDIYINPSEEEPSNGSEEKDKKSKHLIKLLPFETPVTVMLGIAKDAAEKGIEELSNDSNGIVRQALNLPRQAILDSLLEVVRKYDKSNQRKDKEMQSLEHLGEISSEQDMELFLRTASVLVTEFTAEEVRLMCPSADVYEDATYRVIEGETYRVINARGMLGEQSFDLNPKNLIPKTFTRTLERALLRQEENYSHPYGSSLSNDDAKSLLSHTLKRVGQYQRGVLIPEGYTYFEQLKNDVKLLFNQPRENVNQMLLEILRVTQTPFSLETILRLVPAGKDKSFRDAVQAKIGENATNAQFVISKIENPQYDEEYGIRFRNQRVDGPDLIVFKSKDLFDDLAKEPALDAMKSFRRTAENGIDETILGDTRKALLVRTTNVLKRYLAMDKNRDEVMEQLRRFECLTEEEIKDLLAGILVMSQTVLVPSENRPAPFDTLFEDEKNYIATRGEDGNYYFEEVTPSEGVTENGLEEPEIEGNKKYIVTRGEDGNYSFEEVTPSEGVTENGLEELESEDDNSYTTIKVDGVSCCLKKSDYEEIVNILGQNLVVPYIRIMGMGKIKTPNAKEQEQPKAKPRSWGLDTMHLSRFMPVFISAIRRQMESPELKASEYLTAAGIKTVLGEAVSVCERYQERQRLNGEDMSALVDTSAKVVAVSGHWESANECVQKLTGQNVKVAEEPVQDQK